MKRQTILRAVTATVLTLAVSGAANAQLGGALNRARQAAQRATGAANNATQAAENATTPPPATPHPDGVQAWGSQIPKLTETEIAAIDRIMDESKRTAPEVPQLVGYKRLQDVDIKRLFSWGGAYEQFALTPETAKTFKAAIEARTAENLELLGMLYQIPDEYRDDPYRLLLDYDFGESGAQKHGGGMDDWLLKTVSVQNADSETNAGNATYRLTTELEKYQEVMSAAEYRIWKGEVVHRDDGQIETTIDWNRAGAMSGMVFERDGKLVYVAKYTSGLVEPLPQVSFLQFCTAFDVGQIILKREGVEPKDQRDEYWLALRCLQLIVEIQRNSMGMQEKVAVPTPKMNDAALTAEMLRLAREAYPTWNIARLIIDEGAWRPETNALGIIIHRIINTKIILPQGNGYVMRTLSFIQPYAGGSYGATRAHGIGTDNTAVDYKP